AFRGLMALGLPEESLASFPEEFRQGMAARAIVLGDTGANAPQHWDPPLGTANVHALVTVHGRNRRACAERVEAVTGLLGSSGVRMVFRQEAAALLEAGMPVRKEHFGYRDAIGQVA